MTEPISFERAAELESFAVNTLSKSANDIDREQRIPNALIEELGARGYLGATIPAPYGNGWSHLEYGLMHELFGAVCTSTRSLITAHDMVMQTVWRYAEPAVRDRWIGDLADGVAIGAFALTEPHSGRPRRIVTSAVVDGSGYVLDGVKRWISFAQVADVFLVFAYVDGGLSAFLVPRATPGVSVEPIGDLLGSCGSMLGEVTFSRCRVPKDHLVGRLGHADPQIITEALTLGRLGVAAGCVGMTQGCFDAARAYADQRAMEAGALIDQQLVQRQLCDMVVGIEAGRHLYRAAASQLDRSDPAAAMSTMIAKHSATITAAAASRDAVQILGAAGCTPDFPVSRFFRDAKTMEIVEGSNEIQQMVIGRFAGTTPM